jgi:hypothetical protein
MLEPMRFTEVMFALCDAAGFGPTTSIQLPNQALLPTSMSVTDRACARSAPDTLAADL